MIIESIRAFSNDLDHPEYASLVLKLISGNILGCIYNLTSLLTLPYMKIITKSFQVYRRSMRASDPCWYN